MKGSAQAQSGGASYGDDFGNVPLPPRRTGTPEPGIRPGPFPQAPARLGPAVSAARAGGTPGSSKRTRLSSPATLPRSHRTPPEVLEPAHIPQQSPWGPVAASLVALVSRQLDIPEERLEQEQLGVHFEHELNEVVSRHINSESFYSYLVSVLEPQTLQDLAKLVDGSLRDTSQVRLLDVRLCV